MKFMREDEAVSPVIGVILMVAITVILAAVIAAFVFGMGSGVSKQKSVAATAQVIGANTVATYQGGADNSAFGTTGTLMLYCTDSAGTTIAVTQQFTNPAPVVGDTAVCPHSTAPAKDHITVTALFQDGTSQVILDTQV